MKAIFLLVITCLFVSACSTDGKPRRKTFTSAACGNQVIDGYTMTAVHYGDGRIIVLPISKIKPNTEFRILLIPKRRSKTDETDYKKVKVTVTGKTVDELNELGVEADDSSWIGGDGNFQDSISNSEIGLKKGSIVAGCAPKKPEGIELEEDDKAVYRYKIEVEDVGIIDPRLEIDYFGGG